MSYRQISVLAVFVVLLAGCARKPAEGEAESKLADTEKQLEQAKAQPGAEQRVAELEKQLADAKKDLARAKAVPSRTETAKSEPAQAAPVAAPPPPPPPPPKPIEYVIAAGTPIGVRTTVALSTKTAETGAPFEGSLTEPLKVDGVVLAPAGADVSGVVALSDPGGKVKGKASLSIAVTSIKGKHGPIPVETSTFEALAKSSTKKDLVRGGIMTGAGAAIGAIAGGGKGAAIGAGIGAGAGVGTAMATKGPPAEIPAETMVTFTTKAPVTVVVQP